jgi:hypothetical protein
MMGFLGTPARLFYDFCLDEHVPFDQRVVGSIPTALTNKNK